MRFKAVHVDPAEFACLKAIVLFRAGNYRTHFGTSVYWDPFRNSWFEGPKSDRKPAGPSPGHAVAALQGAASRTSGKIREAPLDAATSADSPSGEGGSSVFP